MSIPCLACGFTTWNDLPAPTIPTPNPLALSNHPPNDLDVEEVRTFLTAANRRLEVLNQRISALAPVMNSLTHERDSLLADVRSHKAIVSPLRQLPSEIICRIFVMTLPPLRRLEMPRAPWFLGHICQRWRDIAVGLPILWSSFGIDNEGEKVKKLLEAAASISYDDAVQAQFSRTGQAPLQIAIISTGTSPYARSPLLDRLLAACHRWEVLDVTTEAYFLDMIQEIKGKMPALRHFSANRISPKSVEILESCPSLRGIQARKEGVPPSANVPWHNVTRYSGTVSSDQYLDIFRKTPNLVECRLKFSANANFNDISGDIVVLPSLKRLFVDGASCLERITAPRLEELALRGVLVECDPVRVLSFIERCSCTLDRLTILSGGENGDMSPWLPVLQRMPSLRELTVITKESSTVRGCNDPKGRRPAPTTPQPHRDLCRRYGAAPSSLALLSQNDQVPRETVPATGILGLPCKYTYIYSCCQTQPEKVRQLRYAEIAGSRATHPPFAVRDAPQGARHRSLQHSALQ